MIPSEQVTRVLAEALRSNLRFVPFGGVFGAPTIRIDGVTIGGR
jgi:hypothetical protein